MRQAVCTNCGKPAWVNICRVGSREMEVCAECFDLLGLLTDHSGNHGRSQQATSPGSSGLNHNDPGFDNVIRANEEDR
jgi:hypothetical protein